MKPRRAAEAREAAKAFLPCLVAGVVLAAGALPARVCAGAVSPRGDPWTARDRMDPAGSVPAHPGARLALAVTSWEALAGELRTDLRAAWEPPRGLGISMGWRRYWSADADAADDLEALAVARTAGARFAVGGGLLRRGSNRVARWVAAGEARVLPPLVAGARAAAYPDEESWAPDVTATLSAAWGPWSGGLELGPRAGDLRVSVGLEARPDLVWTTSWAGDHPALGVVWGFGAAELRATQAAHPLLGAVQTLAVVTGGRTP